MAPMPALPISAKDVPETIDDEVVLLVFQSFVILANYVAVQLQRCAVEPAAVDAE